MSLVGEKSKAFSIRVVKLYQYLCREKKEYAMSKQLLRSGTSIGANIAEAEYGISRSDFLSKLYIALKESAETLYWLEPMYETGYISENQYRSMQADAEELRRMLSSSTKSTRQTP